MYMIWVFDIIGILAPVFTPFLQAGQVDYLTIPIYMAYLNQSQVTGILVGGTTGEGMALSVEERKSVLDAWVTAAKPYGTKVIAHVGGAPMPDVIQLATHAEKLKVDGIMTLPELYYKPKTVHQLVSYIKTISEAAPTLPLVYYHFPMMTGVEVNMRELFYEASSKLPNFKGAKADLGMADQVADQLADDQRIFIANHHIAPAVFMGHHSSIATVTNLFPDIIHNIVGSMKSGDEMNARTQQKRLNKLVNTITSEGDFVPSMKMAMELVTGIRVGPTRQPLNPLDSERRKCLRETLISLNVSVQLPN